MSRSDNKRQPTPDTEEQEAPVVEFASSGVPLYYQLATVLRETLVSRQYKAGDRFPSEAELVRDYRVSRMTVRQAVGILEQEGLLQRQAGRGTFVAGNPRRFSGDLELDRSIGDLISMGQSTSVQLLELSEVEANREEARDLDVEEGSPIIRCRRLRFFKDQPYCYIVNHVPSEIGRQIEEPHWCSGSVLNYIEEQLRVPLRIAKQRIRATIADANLARWLQTRVGAPLLLVDYHIRTDQNRPVEMAELYYRSDLYSFTLHLSREGGERERKSWALRESRIEH